MLKGSHFCGLLSIKDSRYKMTQIKLTLIKCHFVHHNIKNKANKI